MSYTASGSREDTRGTGELMFDNAKLRYLAEAITFIAKSLREYAFQRKQVPDQALG